MKKAQGKLAEVDDLGRPQYIRCRCCNQLKPNKDYVQVFTASNDTGFTYLCKSCLQMLSVESTGEFSKKKLYEVCRILDIPFVNLLYERASQRLNSKGMPLEEKRKIGAYLSLINSAQLGYREKTFADSEEYVEEKKIKSIEVLPENKELLQKEADLELWGEGYRDSEYKLLNRKFEALQENYPIRTKLHREMLVKYCKFALREEQAIVQGNINDAKVWGDLARKAAEDAKIKPNQLSAADLSDGISSFSKIAEAIEKEVDIIPILPKFKEKPQDKVDYTLWQFINYNRRLQNLPEVSYQDIYNFLESQYELNSKSLKFLKKEPNGNYDKE